MPNGKVEVVSSGAVVSDATFYMASSRTNSGRTSAIVDPIGAALAIKSVQIGVDAMQSHYFQSSFLNSLA